MGRSGLSESWARVLMDETIGIEETISKLYEQVDALQDKIARMSDRYGEPEKREFIHERYEARRSEPLHDDDGVAAMEGESRHEGAERNAKASALEALATRMRDGTASSAEISATLNAVLR